MTFKSLLLPTSENLNAYSYKPNRGNHKNAHFKNKAMKQELKKAIDQAKSLTELHKVWEVIKSNKLNEDSFLMAWYDFKYNLIGEI